MQLNPYVQTNAAGMFNIESDGFIVGTAMPDPAARFALSGGYLDPAETLPIWGGIAISENVPTQRSTPTADPTRPEIALGSVIARATAYADLTGFAVFDQNYAAINSPQSPVPVTEKGGMVNFYRLGSGARVVLEIDPALVTLEGGLISQQVSWDFTHSKIIAFATTALSVRILQIKSTGCMVPSHSTVTGFTTWNFNGAAALCLL
jgi:hypothetical protein